MKTIYESFEELAEEMCNGEGILHSWNCPEHKKSGDCISWQKGIKDFAEWLDHIGVKVNIPNNAEDFYHFCSKSN